MKVVIMGLGAYKEGSGINAAKFFIRQNHDVLITDLKTANELSHQLAELDGFCAEHNRPLPCYALGGHKEEYFADADLVLRNPGVPKNSPYLKIARENGAKIETDISIFFKNVPAGVRIVGITGTRGKSTVTTLVYELLKTKHPRVWIGGNIKISPLSFLHEMQSGDVVVLELSSWMLENFAEEKIAPHAAIVTNIYPDHLNTYDGMEDYIAAKKNIFAHQTPENYLILNKENAETKKMSGRAKTIYFSGNEAIGVKTNLLGAHNLENIAAALKVAGIFGISVAEAGEVLQQFAGLPDRQELVAEFGGVKFVNDTTATTPDGCLAALRAYGSEKKNIILICGGKDKNLEYAQLAKEILQFCKTIVMFPGTATEKIKQSLTVDGLQLTANDMTDAVRMAYAQAESGDIVLLSPAAASFGLFKNEFDRGEQFKIAVEDIRSDTRGM
jgi:UDP-N-acetylmuramoylalanine--D-glutamate ligase